MSEFKARHWAMLSTFIILVASIAIFAVVSGLRKDPKPQDLGSFEYEGTRTKVIQSGDCQIYMTKFPSQQDIRVFFSCNPR